MKMRDQSVNKGKVKTIKKIRPKKYLIFLVFGGEQKRMRREKRREEEKEEEEEKGKEEQKVWILYGFLWVFMD